VNGRIRGLFTLLAIGFGMLITMTAYWQIWASDSLAARSDNARLVYRQLQIKRGLIFAANGRTVLARNKRGRKDGFTVYTRVYPQKGLFAHAVGYNTVDEGRTGIELSYNDYLTASNADLATQLENLGDTLRGETVTGDNLITSLSVPAQEAARRGMVGHVGAVVALQPSTGRVLAMYSNPTFNPNDVVQQFSQLNRPSAGAPLLNRATQGLYPPGSTFKTVTATAALDTGLYTPEATINAFGSCIEPSQFPIFQQLCNAPGESFGDISLSTAFTYSVNTVFAQIGLKLGHDRMINYMRRYGFWSLPPMDYPGNEMAASGRYMNGHLMLPSKPMDVARVAIGQERLLATPLQMAEVAATVANHGDRMRPTLVDRAIRPGGSVAFTQHPQSMGQVMSTQSAQELTQMMRNVVDEGTGTAAQVGNLPVAGKTGTAEIAPNVNDAWFIAFAPVTHPKIAVAVVVERTPLYGGQVAAPIAANVIRAYLNRSLAQ
jgi:peptidoglycan glycosyltransferase